jgi:hypothetical protein
VGSSRVPELRISKLRHERAAAQALAADAVELCRTQRFAYYLRIPMKPGGDSDLKAAAIPI